MSQGSTPPGWYHAEGDPAGTSRYWDGSQWIGDPVLTHPGATSAGGGGGSDAATGGAATGSTADFEPPTQSVGFGAPSQGGGFAPPQGPAFGAPPPFTGSGAAPVGGRPLVEAGSRIGGRLLDALVWMVLGLITTFPVIAQTVGEIIDAAQEGRDPVEVEISTGLLLITALANLALVLAYEVFMNTRFGGTLGKRAISATIVKEDGSPLDTSSAVMRMVPYIALQVLVFLFVLGGAGSNIPNLLYLIVGVAGLIMLFTDSRRQTPWDKVAKTIVVVR